MDEGEKKKEAILKELELLGEMRRLHEWTTFTHKRAEKVEKEEADIDRTPSAESEACEEDY